MFILLAWAGWTRDLSPGDDVSFGPLRRVWTDDGSFEFHTQLSQWNPSTSSFYHLIEDQIIDSRFLKRIRHRENTPTLWTEATSQKSNPCPSQGEKECAACLLMIKLPFNDTCSDCFTLVAGNWLKPLLFGTFGRVLYKEGKKTTDYNYYLEEFLFFHFQEFPRSSNPG